MSGNFQSINGAGVPELSTTDAVLFAQVSRMAGASSTFALQGLDSGQVDTGFLCQGVLFRLTKSP